MNNKPNKFITTAIDYVNAKPHIGHAYEKIAADIMTRYYRLEGFEVFFLTGVDEHGIKIEKTSKEQNIDTQLFCDEISQSFKQAWKNLDINYDYFIRTTDQNHKNKVQEIFKELKAANALYKGHYNGLYCEGCEDFLRQRDLNSDNQCPNHLKKPIEIVEENYFFALSKYKKAIKEWLESSNTNVLPLSRKNEILNQLDDPELNDFSITRSRNSLSWGINVPDEPGQVIYVWIDALSNYITAIGYGDSNSSFKKWWPATLQLIGKDIIKFHSIYWIAMLMALKLELPEQIFAHGFLTIENQKISKSLGNIIDPVELANQYGSDAIRFYLFSQNNFDQDGDFSMSNFINCVNSHLANNLGNLLNRTITMVERYNEGLIPNLSSRNLTPEIESILKDSICKYHESIIKLQFNEAIHNIYKIIDSANKYINDTKPWSLAKSGNIENVNICLYNCLVALHEVSKLIYPFTPNLALKMMQQLGFSDSQIFNILKGEKLSLIPNNKVLNNGVIFNRIENS